MTATVTPWTLPRADGPVAGRRRRIEDLSAVEREAWERGHAAGREAGIEAVRKEQQALMSELGARVQRLGQTLDLLAQPLAELDEEIHRQLAAVAAAIARQLVRRELKTQPDQIVAVVRETIALLPVAARDVRVQVHPDDAVLLRERLAAREGAGSEDRAWTIIEDPVLSRGGCRVTSENSVIDARVEQRLGAAVAAMLGEERSASREPS